MKLGVTILSLFLAAAFGQTTPDSTATSPGAQTPAEQSRPADDQQGAQRSAVDVKPGPPVIKQKDLWDQSGYLHPFTRMPRYILQDQKKIWTSPFHTSKEDAKFWAIFGGATAALIATDRHIVNHLPNSADQVSVSNWGSRLGSAYSLIPLSAGFYFIGTPAHNDRFRETGLILFETLLDSNLVGQAVKLATDRARPTESDGHGHFEDSPNGRWNSSFPSGHAINTWAFASVVAHQYPHPRIVPILAYGLATTVVVARVGARRHFPGDVVAGSAMGWFIGDYVYGKRHNRELEKPTVAQKILDHVHIGAAIE
jgi:membrane-associated phospholipid phosphatase